VEKCITPAHIITATGDAIRQILEHYLKRGENLKVYTTSKALMHKVNFADGTVDKEDAVYFSHRAVPIQSESEIDEFLERVRTKLEADIEKYTNKSSIWIIHNIENISPRLVKYRLLRGGAANYILPQELAAKKCVINIGAPNNECFKYAIVAALHHEQIDDGNRHKNRRTNYDTFFHNYNFNNVNFPATVQDIVKFQKDNKEIAINALLYTAAKKNKEPKIQPIYHPQHKIVLGRRMCNILLIDDHWLPITNSDRLLGEGKGHAAYCYRCLRNLHNPNRLETHMTRCYNTMGQKVVMPVPEQSVKKFEDWSKMQSPPFAMYADIEAILVPPEDQSTVLQIHKPCTVGSYIVPHKHLNYPQNGVKFHEGVSCVEEFCHYLENECRHFYRYAKQHCNKPQQRDALSDLIYEAAVECEYCNVSFRFVEKVRHHCHVSGKPVAIICQACNSKIRQPIAYLPVFFHNLKNYDMHALCLQGFSKMPGWILKPIAQTKEKYITITAKFEVDRDAGNMPVFYEIRFIDSYQFLSASLDRLSTSLDRAKMPHILHLRDTYNLDDDVLFCKGVFPYSYLDREERLDDRHLPPIEQFWDTLSDSLRTTPQDYQRAQKAWLQFRCNNLKDYLKRYLEVDCLLLADIFENFCATTINDTLLDPANFITLPQFTFAATFREAQCHLLLDEKMYEFFEDGIHGGMCFVNVHHVEAANLETGNPNENTYITYWDENNLYGNALRQLL